MHDSLEAFTIQVGRVLGDRYLLYSRRKRARHERAPLPKGKEKRKKYTECVSTNAIVDLLSAFLSLGLREQTTAHLNDIEMN